MGSALGCCREQEGTSAVGSAFPAPRSRSMKLRAQGRKQPEAQEAPRRVQWELGNWSHLDRRGGVPHREAGRLAKEGATGLETRRVHRETSQRSPGARLFSNCPQQGVLQLVGWAAAGSFRAALSPNRGFSGQGPLQEFPSPSFPNSKATVPGMAGTWKGRAAPGRTGARPPPPRDTSYVPPHIPWGFSCPALCLLPTPTAAVSV